MSNSILLAVVMSASLALAETDTFRWNAAIPANGRLEIRGINGGIRAEPAASSQAEVTAVKTGRRNNPRDVEIRVVEDSGGVTICAVYPSRDSTKPNECKPGGGRMNVRDNDVTVEFTVRVPPGIRLIANTVNGRVETGAPMGDIDASTVNGRITIAAAGCASAKTVNGSIEASFTPGRCSSGVEFSTVNGGITLNLPPNPDAMVEASTVNGDITSEFPITVSGRLSRRRLEAKLGAGGREVSLKTVNGGINLRKAMI